MNKDASKNENFSPIFFPDETGNRLIVIINDRLYQNLGKSTVTLDRIQVRTPYLGGAEMQDPCSGLRMDVWIDGGKAFICAFV